MAGDFGGLFFLALIWAFFKLVSRSREESSPAPGGRPPPRPTAGNDPSQQEGRALERFLRELERAANQGAAGPAGRPAGRPLPPAEDVEEREVLEVAPEVETLEREPRRAQRARVDQDDEAEQVIARRAASAAARSGGQTAADHRKFDQQIRQQPADHTATRALTPQQLRDAIVWREILGPPVSERDR
jgi:hypothetical protein